MIVSMVIMRKLMMISIAYWMNAIMSPTCMVPGDVASPWETIRMAVRFMINIISGIIAPIARLRNRLVAVNSAFACSNRLRSCAGC
jgi:hypothetical protein